MGNLNNTNGNIAKKTREKLIFAVPGFKIYINSFYRNNPSSFLNISLTGRECRLMCKHCRGVLLQSMVDAKNKKISDIVRERYSADIRGILISGGFNKNGVLELDNHYNDIVSLKECYKGLKILIHAGFIDEEMAQKLKSTGCDGVLLNIIGSQSAIEEVYNLKGHKPVDYYRSLKILKNHGIKVLPHIVIGLENDEIKKSGDTDKGMEWQALKNILDIGIDSLVLVSVKKVYRNSPYATRYENKINIKTILELVSFAKAEFPSLKISLGCARPHGPAGQKLEMDLINIGIDSIAFPSEKTVEFVRASNIDFEFRQECCTASI